MRGSELKEKGLARGWGWGCSPTDRGVSTWGKIVKGEEKALKFSIIIKRTRRI